MGLAEVVGALVGVGCFGYAATGLVGEICGLGISGCCIELNSGGCGVRVSILGTTLGFMVPLDSTVCMSSVHPLCLEDLGLRTVAVWESGAGAVQAFEHAAAVTFADTGFEADGVVGIDEGVLVYHVANLTRKREERKDCGVDMCVGMIHGGILLPSLAFLRVRGSGHVFLDELVLLAAVIVEKRGKTLLFCGPSRAGTLCCLTDDVLSKNW